MTHYDNSGSEDGQLRSPGDDQYISGDDDQDEHDTDSLDIKPPQATTHYPREIATKESKKRERFNKEKKHSKEHGKNRERNGASAGPVAAVGVHERERERDRERDRRTGAVFRDGRGEIDRYQRAGGGSGVYDRNDGTVRYQKHYDRGRDNHGLLHHHNQQQPVPMHMHRRQQGDYYERVNDYHHHGNDYHSMRLYGNKHHGQRGDYGHDMTSVTLVSNIQRDREHDRDRDRRKYGSYEGHQDAEILEQDLRSRLLSKRHKYVKDYDSGAMRKHQIDINPAGGYDDRNRIEHGFETAPNDRHIRPRREKEIRNSVIEVFDSPDTLHTNQNQTASVNQQHNKRHKQRREKEREQELSPSAGVLHHSPEDPELVARRSKLLAAGREITKRKEAAREELESRREKKRERRAGIFVDELSPTAVAANVTAGLNIVVKRHKNSEKRKKSKKSKHQRNDYEDGEHRDNSETDAQTDAESDENSKMPKRRKHSLDVHQHGKRKKRKTGKHKGNDDDSDKDNGEEGPTDDEIIDVKKAKAKHSDSESADSVDSYKGVKPKRKHRTETADFEKKHKRKKEIQHTAVDEDDDDDNNENDEEDDDEGDDDDDDEEGEVLKVPDSPLSIGELSKSPERNNRTSKNLVEHSDSDREDDGRFKRSRSQTASRSQTPLTSTHSYSPSLSGSHSRSSGHRGSISSSGSRSRSRSRSSPRSDSSSPSGTHSRSRSRSEERDMHVNLKNANEELNAEKRKSVDNKRSDGRLSSLSPTLYDDKGAVLPNYYPGLQGCRSVEEFQCLNRIEEGTYGVVYRAKDKRTSEIVALKRLKMEKEKEGFPITSLREINTLLKGQHPNIVTVREIVVGSNMDKIFIVMDYVEHDLKSLMETMKTRKQCFLPGEVKCLTQQLLRAVGHLHDNWILHRDLKTSNLLLSHKGILKVGDFGLAREYGSPLKKYTSLVVTLWYRAPELLLCSPEYSTPIDIWSVGCIFAEFLQMAALFPGKSEIDELNRIFKELGTPNEKIWPGYKDLPAVKNLLNQNSQFADYPVSNLRKRFTDKTTEVGISFLHGLLTYDPKQRLNADAALKHPYFKELPLPIDPSMFPTWPAKSELGARKALASSPKPPSGGSQFKQLGRDELVSSTGTAVSKTKTSAGFSGIITGNKKTATNTGFVLNAGIDQRQVAMGPGFNLKF